MSRQTLTPAEIDVAKPLLSVNQVADVCGITRQTVYGFLASGQLRSVRVGARLRVSRSELADFINRTTEAASAEERETVAR